jgi:prolipoprotein diacylglyceryltransferase
MLKCVRIPEMVLHVGVVSVSAHFIFEALAYSVGFALYRLNRRRDGDVVTRAERSSVIVAAILGAAIGSKVLAWLEDPMALLHGVDALWPGGKTIVGGLLGGTIAVEWEKRRLGIRARTGDLFAIPLTIGIAIGRIGCFLGGIDDHTAGTPSHLPWAIDFGDGIPRHPTQLYEIVFLMVLAAVLWRFRSLRLANGDLYRIFLFAYLVWRIAIDFLKPEPVFAGLSSIQWCCALGALWYSRDMIRIVSDRATNRVGAYANG